MSLKDTSMKSILKSIFITSLFVFSHQVICAQGTDQIVTLVVSGQGKTQDEAKQNALRGAIEQAFGTFISSKTEILNDSLIKDEIVSVANGNIQMFEVLSEVQISDAEYSSTLKATVSVTKLTSFVESKGVAVEFKGGLFATNILIQELYEKNEIKAIENLTKILKNISKKSFDYQIVVSDPIADDVKWRVPIIVDVKANNNFINIPTILEQTIRGVSLSASEVTTYSKLGKKVFPISLATPDKQGIYYLRNNESILLIIDFIYSLNNAIANVEIFNGVERFSLDIIKNNYHEYSEECHCYHNLQVFDRNFRIILKYGNDGARCGLCAASLFNNSCGQRQSTKPEFNFKELYYHGGYNIEFKDCFPGFLDEQSNFGFIKTWLKKEKIYSYPRVYPPKYRYTHEDPLGLVISFAKITTNTILVQFYFSDIRTIDELKKITKYEILKQE